MFYDCLKKYYKLEMLFALSIAARCTAEQQRNNIWENMAYIELKNICALQKKSDTPSSRNIKDAAPSTIQRVKKSWL